MQRRTRRTSSRVDAIVRIAARNGIVVLLDPIETGGWLQCSCRTAVKKDFAYGRSSACATSRSRTSSGSTATTFSMAGPRGDRRRAGRRPRDQVSDKTHIQTVELNYDTSGSRDDPSWTPIIGLDAAYTYYPTYAQVLKEYNRPDHIPMFMVEANYEFEQSTGPADASATGVLVVAEWRDRAALRQQVHVAVPRGLGGPSRHDRRESARVRHAALRPRRGTSSCPISDTGSSRQATGRSRRSGSVNDNDYVTAAEHRTASSRSRTFRPASP